MELDIENLMKTAIEEMKKMGNTLKQQNTLIC